MNSDVRVNRNLVIPGDEVELTFTTSSGPGGQHANKASTRVELRWNVAGSAALGPRQRQRLLTVLGPRIDGRGNLRLASKRHRSQLRNREDVIQRFTQLVADALIPAARRVPTKPSRSATERRLRSKRKRADIKRSRRTPPGEV